MGNVGTGALAAQLRAGDQSAFAELYRDYAERLYGFCIVLLRDREEAADATHDTFVLAAQRVQQLRDPERLRPWLFAIARHVCYRRLAQSRRATPVELEPDVLVIDADPGAAVSAEDARALVWAAAASLNERDRAVINLSLREELEGDDLADALGVQQANPHSLLYRAKGQLERAIGVLVVARAGRRDCPTLASMLEEWDGTLTPIMRKRLGRHMSRCVACQSTKSRALPLSALAAVPMLRPAKAQAWSEAADPTTIDELLQIAARRPLLDERWLANGFPPLVDEPKRRRRRVAFFVIGVVGIACVAAFTVNQLRASDGTAPGRRPAAADPNLAVVREPGVTTTTKPAGTTTSTTAPAGASQTGTVPAAVSQASSTTIAVGTPGNPVVTSGTQPPTTPTTKKKPPVTNPPVTNPPPPTTAPPNTVHMTTTTTIAET